ncbi:serine protease [Bosea sp. PAMC 26642]|uniref:serine protease n=1 Tax=Bosea sp. (strain PAMC 26642) TaxID=1792307 RepID=UPI0007701A81|nr:serine protease [Bosea sp. PAMC 26642]AMJ61325.1 hypothetical protein AXW83_14395 [Bosea sp. PAMC 26642]
MIVAKGYRFGSLARLRLSLAAPILIALLAPATAQPAPSPQIAVAQASFESLPEAERKAIQTDLIWVGLLNSAASGAYGPLTFRAINTVKAASRGVPDGMLTPGERRVLAQQAQAARDATGFRLIVDERTGVRIGIPEKVLPRREATPTGGSRWQSGDGRVTLDATTSPPGESLEALFEKATAVNANVPGRKITYKLLRPDFFVVTGETATGKFYRRLAAGPQGLRGFSIGYEKTLSAAVDPLVIAIASSFEPFPTGPAPSSAPAAVAAAAAPPIVAVVARPIERFGVALALSDKLALTAIVAIEPCRGVRVGGRPARLRFKDDASGLAVLDLDAGTPNPAPALRAEALGERESVVLVAFGDDVGKRAAQALPGQSVRVTTGSAVFAPLQPGQAGSPVFDRQGRLAGLVTANPSDKVLVAGIAPQRSYTIADTTALQAVLAKAGATPGSATTGPDLSTGAVIDRVGKAVLPVSCGL